MSGDALVPIDLPLALVPTGRGTLRSYVSSFLGSVQFVQELSPHTVAAYGDALRSFLAFTDTHGLLYAEQVTPGVVEAYTATLRHREGKSISTVNHRRHALISFFRFLERERAMTGNPAKIAYGIKAPRRLPEGYLNDAQRNEVLEQLGHGRSVAGLRDLAIVGTLAMAGLRAAELVALRVANVDRQEGTIHVTSGKGRRERYAPLVPWLREVFDRYLTRARPVLLPAGADDDTLFISRLGGPLTTRGLYYLVVRVVSPIVGRRVHPHQLRHTFASSALGGGATLAEVQKALGHSDLRTTGIYLHLPDKGYVRSFSKALGGEAAEAKPADPKPVETTASAPPLPDDRPVPTHPFADPDVQAWLRERRRARR